MSRGAAAQLTQGLLDPSAKPWDLSLAWAFGKELCGRGACDPYSFTLHLPPEIVLPFHLFLGLPRHASTPWPYGDFHGIR